VTYVLQKRNGVRAVVDNRDVIIFSTNDYLSLSSNPEVKLAVDEANERYGAGSGGAPGTTGTTILHNALCRAVAEFKARDEAVLFPSGYQANIAIHNALGAEGSVFFLDRRHHPSAVDGTRLSKNCEQIRFNHNKLDELESRLASISNKRKIVSLPSVFTIDGDIAPLDKLIKLKDKYNFILVIDEAHASGCLGKRGHGLEEHFGLQGAADFVMGTFSKAFGSAGGFVAFDDDRRELLKSGFRQFDYSTSLSPLSSAAALKALEIMRKDLSIFERLHAAKVAIFEYCQKAGIHLVSGESMILLLPCDNCEDLQRKMLADGFLVMPSEAEIGGEIRSCIRITANASHTENNITAFVAALKRHL